MSLLLLTLTAVAVLITSFISGVFGMAGGMLLMGYLLLVLPVAAAMVLHGLTQFASNGWRAWLWRRMIDWRVVRGYGLGIFLALLIFVLMRLVVSKPMTYILLGLVPFISFALPSKLKLNVERRGHAFLCGVSCTVLQLVTGVSGLLLDVFFVHSKMDRRQAVATKAATQTMGHFVKVLYFGGLGASLLGDLSIGLAAMCVLTAMLGATLARRTLEGMNDDTFRRWTRGIVLTAGSAYLIYGFYLWAPL